MKEVIFILALCALSGCTIEVVMPDQYREAVAAKLAQHEQYHKITMQKVTELLEAKK